MIVKVQQMAHILPRPMVHAKCGTCFYDLTWSEELCTFECTYCMTKIVALPDGHFKTIYSSEHSVPCGQPPAESFKRVRHLRLNENKERYFVIFSFTFFPCSLPKGHGSQHYFHYVTKYSEETLQHQIIREQDI